MGDAPRTKPTGAIAKAEAAIRAHAMAKPEATEHFPWGERAIKVKGKVFVFMWADASVLSLSTKLPESSPVALLLPFAEPTGYGLGKAGWVSAKFPAGSAPPLEMLLAWVDESYRAVAPKKLSASGPTPKPQAKKPARPKAKRPAPRAGRARAAR
jgi:predicted DNA-binding protein (MmcQ/YjbR family)